MPPLQSPDLLRPATPNTVWDLAPYLRLRRRRDALLRWPVAWLAKWGVPPWLVSLAGVGLAATTLWTLPDRSLWALVAFVGALCADAVDGALARRLGCGSWRGKAIDQLCDSATFVLLLAAIAGAGAASWKLCGIAAGIGLTLQLLGVWHFNQRFPRLGSFYPRAGFFAHSPKALVYSGLLWWLVSGENLLPAAIFLANALSLLFAAGFVAALIWLAWAQTSQR